MEIRKKIGLSKIDYHLGATLKIKKLSEPEVAKYGPSIKCLVEYNDVKRTLYLNAWKFDENEVLKVLKSMKIGSHLFLKHFKLVENTNTTLLNLSSNEFACSYRDYRNNRFINYLKFTIVEAQDTLLSFIEGL